MKICMMYEIVLDGWIHSNVSLFVVKEEGAKHTEMLVGASYKIQLKTHRI